MRLPRVEPTTRITGRIADQIGSFGLKWSLMLFVGSMLALLLTWPPRSASVWLIEIGLLVVSIAGIAESARRWIQPEALRFTISEDEIVVVDRPYFTVQTHRFEPMEITRVHYGKGNHTSEIVTKSGRKVVLSDVLMQEHGSIFEELARTHPHIELTESHGHIG